MKLTCIRTGRKHVEALQLEDVKQIVTNSYIVETERTTVSNRIAGATVTVPSVRRTLANLFDPCLTRTHVLRQSCRFFLKYLWYAAAIGFISSTNLRAATLLLIL
jgi:hypothetical protein